MILKDGIRLYHGSYAAIQQPNLEYCKENKDFGKGFYATTSKKQAKSFVSLAVEKARREGVIDQKVQEGFITGYIYRDTAALKKHEFSDADREWLRCIVAHRRRHVLPEEYRKWELYDIISGKVANDYTNLVITVYLDGLYGEILSEKAEQTAISNLEPDKLINQVCFRSTEAIKCLTYVSEERIKV